MMTNFLDNVRKLDREKGFTDTLCKLYQWRHNLEEILHLASDKEKEYLFPSYALVQNAITNLFMDHD